MTLNVQDGYKPQQLCTVQSGSHCSATTHTQTELTKQNYRHQASHKHRALRKQFLVPVLHMSSSHILFLSHAFTALSDHMQLKSL